MSDNDAQLEIKKRARRRLVGAVALALAAAIILPMVMDSEPRSTANELQIRIPSQEGGNYTARLINSTASAPVAMAPLEPAVEESAPVAPPPKPAPVASAPLEKPPVAPIKETAPPKETAPANGAARAQSLLEGSEPAKPAAAESKPDGKSDAKRFYVQLGVYRDAENVKSLRAKIKTAGYSSVVEPVGESSRVRVGPFVDREAADKALAKLKKSGLNGMVVAPK